MSNLIKQLATQAKENGICDEWYSRLLQMSPNDKAALVRMYLSGIDFCLSNNYPSNGFIKRYFADIAPQMGVYVDMRFKAENMRKCVCLGVAEGKALINGFNVGEVFLKHNAKLALDAADDAFVMVDVFDQSELTVEAHGNAKVTVNRYGGKITWKRDPTAKIVIREKNKHNY